MELNIADRIHLASILPTEGGIIDLIHAEGIRDAVKINSDEANDIELKADGKNMFWNAEKARILVFEPKSEQVALVKGVFSKLDAEKKMRAEWLGVYGKFKDL